MLLALRNLDSGYGFFQVLWNISISIAEGEYVCIIGPNGAGKSTILKTISGLCEPMRGEIIFRDESIGHLPGYDICKRGVSYVSEELNLFTGMTVRENLLMGAYTVRDKKLRQRNLEFVFNLFPRLKEREKQLVGTMSGGERKMLAIACGLMPSPSILMVDEPSLGLAPQLVQDVFSALNVLKNDGMTILLVEQNVNKTLKVTDRGYVLEKGKIVLEGKSSDLAQDDHVKNSYLGL